MLASYTVRPRSLLLLLLLLLIQSQASLQQTRSEFFARMAVFTGCGAGLPLYSSTLACPLQAPSRARPQAPPLMRPPRLHRLLR